MTPHCCTLFGIVVTAKRLESSIGKPQGSMPKKVVKNDVSRRDRLIDLFMKPCVHNCGVMPETENFMKGGAPYSRRIPDTVT